MMSLLKLELKVALANSFEKWGDLNRCKFVFIVKSADYRVMLRRLKMKGLSPSPSAFLSPYREVSYEADGEAKKRNHEGLE